MVIRKICKEKMKKVRDGMTKCAALWVDRVWDRDTGSERHSATKEKPGQERVVVAVDLDSVISSICNEDHAMSHSNCSRITNLSPLAVSCSAYMYVSCSACMYV